MVLWATDAPNFLLRFVLITSCGHAQEPRVPSGEQGGGGAGKNR